jgi:hypothetical protein
MRHTIRSAGIRASLLAGLCCALVCGGVVRASEVIVIGRERKRRPFVRPRPVPEPHIDPSKITEAQKKRANELVDKFMAGKDGTKPSAEEKKKIAKLIKDFASDEYTVREAASKAILKFGAKALEQLREALKSKDAEVVQRADSAIKAVGNGSGNKLVTELRTIYAAAVTVINQRHQKWETRAYTAELMAIALENRGRKEEAAKKRKQQAAAKKKATELKRLMGLVRVRPRVIDKVFPRPLPGVRLMMERKG